MMTAPLLATPGCKKTEKNFDAAKAMLCHRLDNLSPDEMNKIFEAAAKKMAEEGHPIDASAFADSGQLTVFLGLVSSIARCQPDPNETIAPEPGIHANYCGPGNGPELPSVSSCLNKLCYEHDACYYMCSEHAGKACMWARPTHPCDDAMMAAVDHCAHEPGTVFRSRAVIWLAKRAYTLGAANECPQQPNLKCGGEHGNGPCKDAIGTGDAEKMRACLQGCAEKKDPGLSCLKKNQCDFDGDGMLSIAEAVCYAANCEIVEDCF